MELNLDKAYFAKLGLRFDEGLSDAEVTAIQEKFGFVFPPDLRSFLQFGLPIGSGFINWRKGDANEIQDRVDWPYRGICFDIELNGFWPQTWGERPSKMEDAFAVAKNFLDLVPKLIPIYSHRYIPDSPNESGNPVFSVYQTDIIVYGVNLGNYLENEFGGSEGIKKIATLTKEKHIEFWSDVVERNNNLTDAI